MNTYIIVQTVTADEDARLVGPFDSMDEALTYAQEFLTDEFYAVVTPEAPDWSLRP